MFDLWAINRFTKFGTYCSTWLFYCTESVMLSSSNAWPTNCLYSAMPEKVTITSLPIYSIWVKFGPKALAVVAIEDKSEMLHSCTQVFPVFRLLTAAGMTCPITLSTFHTCSMSSKKLVKQAKLWATILGTGSLINFRMGGTTISKYFSWKSGFKSSLYCPMRCKLAYLSLGWGC